QAVRVAALVGRGGRALAALAVTGGDRGTDLDRVGEKDPALGTDGLELDGARRGDGHREGRHTGGVGSLGVRLRAGDGDVGVGDRVVVGDGQGDVLTRLGTADGDREGLADHRRLRGGAGVVAVAGGGDRRGDGGEDQCASGSGRGDGPTDVHITPRGCRD